MDNQNLSEATYRLAKENNEMLHSMRRRAFLGGVIRTIIFIALLAAPIWFYMTYLNASMQSLIKAVNAMEGTNASVSAQGAGFMEQLKKLEAAVPGVLQKLQQSASSTTPR